MGSLPAGEQQPRGAPAAVQRKILTGCSSRPGRCTRASGPLCYPAERNRAGSRLGLQDTLPLSPCPFTWLIGMSLSASYSSSDSVSATMRCRSFCACGTVGAGGGSVNREALRWRGCPPPRGERKVAPGEKRRRQHPGPTLLAWPSAAASSASPARRRLGAAAQGRRPAVSGWRRPSGPAAAVHSLGATAACMAHACEGQRVG